MIDSDVKWGRIPEHMKESLIAYVEDRRPVGHFLTAVLSNDLCEAFGRADDTNRECMFDYVCFLYNYATSQCWGSPERVKSWLEGTE